MEAPYSLSKATYHTDRIKSLQEGKPIPPTNIQVDLEAYCNDNCPFCSYRADESWNAKAMLELITKTKLPMMTDYKPIGSPTKDSSLPAYFADELPRQLDEAGIPSVTFTGGGESTLWPAYDRIIDNLARYGIEIGLITNGSVLTDHRIEMIAKHYRWIRFSMDACTQETHREMHHTPNLDFERRIGIIKKLVEKRQESGRIPDNDSEGLTIGINFVITDQNFHEIEESCKFYSELGVDYIRFSFMYIDGFGMGQISKENLEKIRPIFRECVEKYSRPEFTVTPASYKMDSYSHPNDDFETCYMQRFVWALGANCKVYPCCIQKYIPGWELADIRETTLKEMILSVHEKMKNLDVKQCPPCWMRDRNKAMASAIDRPKHANFV